MQQINQEVANDSVENSDWINSSNYGFYNELPIKEFRDALALSGLDTCVDMVLIQSHIDNATHILEVGAGLGRATQYLCQNSNGAIVEAVEFSDKLYKYLSTLNLPAIIHKCDILKFTTENKFDLIILPWACLAEFNQAEQLKLFKHLDRLSMSQATICMDLVLPNVIPGNARKSSGQHHSVKCGQFKLDLDTYLPTDEQMANMANKAGFVNYHNINYVTKTKRLRKMHIMHKR